MSDFSYCLTSELHDFKFRIQLLDLELLYQDYSPDEDLGVSIEEEEVVDAKGLKRNNRKCTSFYLELQLWANNKPISLKVKTKFHEYEQKRSNTDTEIQNSMKPEWIEIPITYSNLSLSTILAITIWSCADEPRQKMPLGGTSFRIFGKHKTLRKGTYRLHVWPDCTADGLENTSTPSKLAGRKGTEVDRLDTLYRKFQRGDLHHVDWLDNLAIKEMERLAMNDSDASSSMILHVKLPIFDFPVVFNEKEYSYPDQISLRQVYSPLLTVVDPELSFHENLVENRHRKLARSHRTGPSDRELKPNAKIRDELYDILKYPLGKPLSDQEKDLLWKFRFYLSKDKKALTKFLKSVIWTDAIEAKQAIEILSTWVAIDVEDALELLGPEFSDIAVRSFAVGQLQRAGDDELSLYLLQLVQALKFERLDQKQDSSLVLFLIERGATNQVLGNTLYWYLMVETEDKKYGKIFAKVVFQFLKILITKPEGINRRDNLRRQGELIASLSKISREFRASKESRPKKIEKLRAFIADPKNGLLSFPPLSLPLDPTIQVTGLIPEKAGIFKSQLQPLHLTFTCLDGSEYTIIYKTGDDLRQDQLIVQIITLMDNLLRKENLDLRITSYKVVATGIDQGMIQFIPSKAIASILSEFGNSLLPYLSQASMESPFIPPTLSVPNPADLIDKHKMDTYTRSIAGYCVMTYLLGVGDRHLDNLLLTRQGHLFHIDFGFILGRDPKPFPPPMKLCKEMVELMGGASSPQYQQFRSYSFIAFNSLRKNANLILNLFSLMVRATLPDIAIEPEKAVSKVQERFQLDLTDEEAIYFFQDLINESIQAYFPQIVEQLHRAVQYFKS